MNNPKPIHSYRKYWAECLCPAPELPMSRAEMDRLGWDSCDIVIVSGDAYVDHPSFGMAIIGRALEAQGFRVGIIAQPDWQSKEPFRALGKPNLFFGITAGNMDSMINRYTSDRKIRHDDAYTPGGAGGKRPDRSVTVYAQRCREAYKEVPVIIGGIEASLRRLAHYDYWSDKVRRSILLDAKADLLLYGNAERAITEIAHRLAQGERVENLQDIRGTAFIRKELPDAHCIDLTTPHSGGHGEPIRIIGGESSSYLRLPSYEAVSNNRELYAHASRTFHQETNPGNARPLVQRHGEREVWINPPPIPLTTEEMDWVFDQPFTRKPHSAYGSEKIPAYEMIRFSVNIMRGCYGGCSFCSITEHEGRIIQSRSAESITAEIEKIRDLTPGFTGVISDLGGPTANMWRTGCKDEETESQCRRLSCVFPVICKNLNTNQLPLVDLYRETRKLPGIKKLLIASGVRYDLAIETPEYVKELVTHHVGGYLKIAPEHTEAGPLSKMMKPDMTSYEAFRKLFEKYTKEAGKEQYLIPYFIAAHPGTTDEDMMNLALWLKQHGFRADQVQNFYPSPMANATTMYHTGLNPLKKIGLEEVFIPKGERQRRLHKAFLRYHDPENWEMLREALTRLGRTDLIGNGKNQLVPRASGRVIPGKAPSRPFLTTHTRKPGGKPGKTGKTGKRR